MQIKNNSFHFGLVSIILHWFMAILILGMLGLGLYMIRMPDGAQKYALYGWHKAFGILILILIFVRITWSMINTVPALILPWYERIAARLTHGLLYLIMIALPLSGWLLSSAAGHLPSFFGLFTLPGLVEKNQTLSELFGTVHEWLAYSLIGLIIIHILGALKHHFIDRNDVLKRML